jgi:hypothetical protein
LLAAARNVQFVTHTLDSLSSAAAQQQLFQQQQQQQLPQSKCVPALQAWTSQMRVMMTCHLSSCWRQMHC